MIYLDHAATTPTLPNARSVLNTILSVPANPNSTHSVGESARESVEDSRKIIARCVHANPDEIYFTYGATEACIGAMDYLSSHCAITQVSAVEHHAVLDFPVRTGESEEHAVGYAQMLVNNETGEIFQMPTREHKNDLIFTDATAAVGHMPIDVKKLGVDLMAAGGHKFGAPCGIGFLYARRGLEIPHRSVGTPPVALIAAMAAALAWQTGCMVQHTERVNDLRGAMLESLLNVPNTLVNSPIQSSLGEKIRLPHILNISFSGVDGKTLALLCSKRGVMISAGAACTSGNNEPSHVIMAMYGSESRARSAVRISFSHTNTVEEVKKAASIIAECVAELRAIG